MKNNLICFFVFLSLLASPLTAFSWAANSQAVAFSVVSSVAEVPLAIIRFNQPRVYYKKRLYKAISRAVEIKPTVRFELVSYIPVTGHQKTNIKHRNSAGAQLNDILKTLQDMGIPRNKIKVSQEPDNGIIHHEAHLYVY